MNTKKMKPSNFLRLLFINKNMKTADVADKIGKTPSAINGNLRNESMNLSTLKEIMAACDEPLTLVLKTGEKFELDLDE